jgi:hypothetical protein
MKRAWLLFSFPLLAAGMSLGQAGVANGTSASAQDENPAVIHATANPQAVIRGCLSSSPGNYTLTDQNGMQYQVTGSDASLRAMTGHEVEINGMETQAGDSNDSSGHMAAATNSIQASEVREVAGNCKRHNSGAAPALGNPESDQSPTKPNAVPPSRDSVSPSSTTQSQQQSAPDKQ